jgi:hypothetical protein
MEHNATQSLRPGPCDRFQLSGPADQRPRPPATCAPRRSGSRHHPRSRLPPVPRTTPRPRLRPQALLTFDQAPADQRQNRRPLSRDTPLATFDLRERLFRGTERRHHLPHTRRGPRSPARASRCLLDTCRLESTTSGKLGRRRDRGSDARDGLIRAIATDRRRGIGGLGVAVRSFLPQEGRPN